MSSAVAANTLGLAFGDDAINGIYKIIRCRSCQKYSMALPSGICPHCGRLLTGPSAGISLYDGEVLYCEKGFKNYSSLSNLAKRSSVTAYDVVDQRILDLIRNNRNWFGGICGETGTGKSYASLRIGEMVDRRFDSEKVAFNVIELLQLIDSVNAKDLIIFDEAEAWNARRAMKAENVVMGEIMAMLRYTQINIACTMPDLEMIDLNARRLMHDYLRTQYIQRDRAIEWKKDKSAVDWYVIKKSKIPLNDKSNLFFVRPIIEYVDHINNVRRKEKCGTVYLNAPDPTLLEEYEKRKDNNYKVKLKDVLKMLLKFKKDLPEPLSSEEASVRAVKCNIDKPKNSKRIHSNRVNMELEEVLLQTLRL